METVPREATSVLDSIRRLGDGLLASVQDRLELFSLEFKEEKFRLIRTFVWISAVVFTGMMAITFASLTVVYLFWETARLAALGGLTLLYIGALLAMVIGFRRYLARQPSPFADSLSELRQDRTCILPKS